MKERSLYIKGNEKEILYILEQVRPLISKERIFCIVLDEELEEQKGDVKG